MAAIHVPTMRLLTQGKEYMPKTTTIDPGVLEMALVGYELQRDRIEASIAEIQAELGQSGTRHSAATATDSSEPKPPGKKRFSAAARRRMAAAQRKRWQLLKAKKAEAAKPKHKTAAKRKTATVTASRKQRPVKVKAAKKVALKSTARKAAPAIPIAVAKPEVQEPTPRVQAAVEPAPATE
jgi:hypothetical protein